MNLEFLYSCGRKKIGRMLNKRRVGTINIPHCLATRRASLTACNSPELFDCVLSDWTALLTFLCHKDNKTSVTDSNYSKKIRITSRDQGRRTPQVQLLRHFSRSRNRIRPHTLARNLRYRRGKATWKILWVNFVNHELYLIALDTSFWNPLLFASDKLVWIQLLLVGFQSPCIWEMSNPHAYHSLLC